jgi:ribonuclease HI
MGEDNRVSRCEDTVKVLYLADQIAANGWFVNSGELADMVGCAPAAITARGDQFVWRNWIVDRVRREGNQLLWALSRIEGKSE